MTFKESDIEFITFFSTEVLEDALKIHIKRYLELIGNTDGSVELQHWQKLIADINLLTTVYGDDLSYVT